MGSMKNSNSRLFNASCIALVVTSMTFAIRAGILEQLNIEFGLSDFQLGWVNSMAFFGFPVAMIIGGLLYNSVGPRKLMWVAFTGHLLGLTLTIFATGFWGLIVSTFFIGLVISLSAIVINVLSNLLEDPLGILDVLFFGTLAVAMIFMTLGFVGRQPNKKEEETRKINV